MPSDRKEHREEDRRIVQLITENRDIAGTYGFVTEPVVGDVGEVIFEYPPIDGRMTVQKSDAGGHVLWFADFRQDEVEFLPQAEDA